MSVWTTTLGAKLKAQDGSMVDTEAALKDVKAVGLYFSAHWCPPCRMFTPKLGEMYTQDLKAKGFEIVFVSSDRDENAFNEYSGEQPWLSLPYNEREKKDALSKKYKVEGIPSFVILAPDGSTITKKGREAVSQDPKGEDFPWYPKSLQQILGTEFLDNNKKPISIDAFNGKKLGLYFSAHWCPPCRDFTPVLTECYKSLTGEKGSQKDKFDIIFISSDREEDQFSEYFAEMPWKCIPYADRKRKEELGSHFEVSGIPCLVILDEDRKVISANATGKVRADREGKKFPWLPELVNELDEDADGVDEAPSVVVLQEEVAGEEKAKNSEAILPLAKKYRAAATDGEQEFNFFLASADGELSERVRDECGGIGEKEKTVVVLLNIQDRGGYYAFPADTPLTTDSLTQFLQDFKDEKLTRLQMGG